jgi:probable phosphoglycerate mutase
MTADAPTPPELDSTQAVAQPTLRSALDGDSCEVLLIRHGRSADVVPGTPESADPPLHEIGHTQAAALTRRLAPVTLHGVYSSHLARAVQTASPLAEARGLVLETFPDLREIDLGDWSLGEFRRRAATQDPEFVAWSLTGRWDGIPGSEGDDALRSRFAAVVETLAGRHRGERIAVVAHGGAINAYLSHLLGVYRSLWMTVENTSITLVRLHPVQGSTVVSINDCHHLYDPVVGVTA